MAFFAFYQKYLKPHSEGGLNSGFCTSLASTALDLFWAGSNDIHARSTLDPAMRARLTSVHGRLLSRQALVSLHDQGRKGTGNVLTTFQAIESNFRRGGTRWRSRNSARVTGSPRRSAPSSPTCAPARRRRRGRGRRTRRAEAGA